MCLSIGIDYDSFWLMTPRVLDIHIQGFERRRREIDRQQYYQGAYFYEAISTALYNVLRNKKPAKDYRDRPFMEPPETDEERMDREIRQAILNEELWIADAHKKGLPETVINK